MSVLLRSPRRAPAAITPQPAIAVAGLTKRYGDRQVLQGIDLEIRRGELIAIVGPNGSGKTTMVEILEGDRLRDGGAVSVLGADPAHPTREWRARAKASAAVPLGTGVTLALYFLSGNFFIIEDRPLLLRVVGAAFPVKHLNDALLTPLNPNANGSRIEWVDLLVIVAWGLAALLVALRWFRWTAARREA